VKRKIRVAFKRDLAPPITVIDFYSIGRVLGKGAYGKVNLALHRLTRRLCAVKSINVTLTSDKNTFLKLHNEIFIHKSLRHQNVCTLLESIETFKHHLMFLELCRGGDLLHYVRRRRRLDEEVAKYLFKQIVVGIEYIHSKNIIHRDIKLENILLDNLGVVKICDFGVSKLLPEGPESKATECCGTPAYMAPEVIMSALTDPILDKSKSKKSSKKVTAPT